MSTQYTGKQQDRIVNTLDPVDREEVTREALREMYGTIEVCGLTMDAARCLEEVDNVAFRCTVNDYIDSRVTDGDMTDEIRGDHYWTSEVDELLEEMEAETEETAQ